jgi:hypothetical protein
MERQPHETDKPEMADYETDEHKEGLASVVGIFNDDPAWREIQEYVTEYCREMDEHNKG